MPKWGARGGPPRGLGKLRGPWGQNVSASEGCSGGGGGVQGGGQGLHLRASRLGRRLHALASGWGRRGTGLSHLLGTGEGSAVGYGGGGGGCCAWGGDEGVGVATVPRRLLWQQGVVGGGVCLLQARGVKGSGWGGGGLEGGDEGVAYVGGDGARERVFLRKNCAALRIQPHEVRNLQLTHFASAIRQQGCSDGGCIAGNQHLQQREREVLGVGGGCTLSRKAASAGEERGCW